MSEKNLPIKIVLPKASDNIKNHGMGSTTFFGDITPELKNGIVAQFEQILTYYSDVFEENPHVPAVGKITVKPEAIAKSHKPNDLCRNLPIIGGEGLEEIYIKVTPQALRETISLVKNPPSEKFKANLTAISNIEPITANEKISQNLVEVSETDAFEKIKSQIKIKLFDFDDEYDNSQIVDYVFKKLNSLNSIVDFKRIQYGENIHLIRAQVNSYEDIISIASINGVKSVDFFQEYSLPIDDFISSKLETLLEDEYSDSDQIIGIIDGGISDDNPHLAPFIYSREEYVSEDYRNTKHGTFIASTIQYGNKLNNLNSTDKKRFKFLDIIAIPNSDADYGQIDSIGEVELMEIIEEVMETYANKVKVWNLSLGIENIICMDKMSDLGMFLDYIQDKYQVQIFVSSGNLNQIPLRTWPPQEIMGERDRIIAPADSVRAITVGSVSLYDSPISIVKRNEPSPFSRRGPGPNHIVKPDVVDYGGNLDTDYNINGLGMKGLDPDGCLIEGNGTSYSTPRVAQKFANVYDELIEKDLMLAKAMVIHSARIASRELLDQDPDNIKYFGFGIPSLSSQDILQCSEDEVTLVFRQKVAQGTHLEMFDFPYPPSLIRDGKYHGEIGMTLVYNPLLDQRYGQEYCRTNIDVHFGTYKFSHDGKIKFKGCVPLESAWDDKYEQTRVENGFKWSPVKSYYRKIKKGMQVADGWKIRIDMTPRNGLSVPPQEFVLIVTIRDPEQNDIYSEVVNGLREKGYITTNLETKVQLRERQ